MSEVLSAAVEVGMDSNFIQPSGTVFHISPYALFSEVLASVMIKALFSEVLASVMILALFFLKYLHQ